MISLSFRRPQDTPSHRSIVLYIDAEEHELGDLGEPANYKAALLDPESKKWLDAINVEMQSMKYNYVWVLVELPPNARTVGSKWLFKKKTDMDGAVYIFKARLVAKGFTQTYRVDYEETFSSLCRHRATRFRISYSRDSIKYAVRMYILVLIVAFAQNMTNRFQQNPGEEHWTAVKIILKYLRNTKDMFLVYGGNMERELGVSCYTNVGYLTDADNLKSQTGYVFILNGGVVDWKSTKQSIFATSSIDAEYIAAFDASKEAVWIRKFISGLGIVPSIEEPISMYCRINTRAIAIAKMYGMERWGEKIDTDDNLADPFTNALAFPKHSELTRNIGLLPASSFM
ncbi:zinc finger, CCHC-type containing protein [Tanacetum coccineum]|uniref:Zinc finger, CCHC-type containing protein n=1 Tax=Tanacetum coccineum TaxID=301880 RepID=A0ABQ5BMJ0_9ASTR